jgi:hypothetical protein
MNACDPDADIQNLRKLIKLNTGIDIKLTKKEICEAYQDIQDDKLPLPPMVMNSTRTYLVDKKSPLKPNDYEQLFDSTTKRVDLKRIARKVGLKNIDQMTKMQITDAIGRRLRYMKVHEPVRFARRKRASVTKNTAVNGYNTNINSAMNNNNLNRVNNNNTAVNRVNNASVNNTAVNRVNNTAVNRVNNTAVNRVNNTAVNRVNNTAVNRVNNTAVNNTAVNTRQNRPKNKNSKVTFPSGSLFTKGEKPKFLGGTKSAVKTRTNNSKPAQPNKKGFFAGLFGGKKEEKKFIAANKFKGSKSGYVFRKGNKGPGYYINNGRIQGPQLPSVGYNQPVPAIVPKNEDFSIELALARVKQLGLRGEKRFVDEISKGISKRKNVVQRAEQARKEENEIIGFLEQLDLTNANRAMFIQRVATGDFKSLKVEAQLKSDEKRNIVRTNEQKMTMFLETTTLDAANRQSFINRAGKEGSNVNALIVEAKKLQETKKSIRIQKKKDQFKQVLSNYALSNADKQGLIGQITEDINVNSMKKLASELVTKRKDEKKNAIQLNLLSFLQPLEIPQSNKNMILKKVRVTNTDINTLKREALNIQKKRKSESVNADKKRLMNRLEQLGLTQINQNVITKKFSNGNRNIDKLIEEAKKLKQSRNKEAVNTKRKEYSSFLNTLQSLTVEDKQTLLNGGNYNQNKARALAKERATQAKALKKNNFSTFLNELGLVNKDKTNMMNLYNGNTITVNALKRKATELKNKRVGEKKLANKDALKKNLENATNLDNATKTGIMKKMEAGEANLATLRKEITQLVQKAKNNRLANKKQKFEKSIQNSTLSNSNKNAFIRKLNNSNLNLNALRKELNTMIEKSVETQRAKDRDELEEYMVSKKMSNTERNGILSKFNANGRISLDILKKEANALLKERVEAKRVENASNLNSYSRKLGLNNATINTLTKKLNREDLNSLKAEANRIAQKKANNFKNAENNELKKYMSNIGLNANNKRNVIGKKLPLSESKKFANNLLQKKIEEKRNKNKAALSVILNKLNITNTENRNKFMNKLKNGGNINAIKQNAIKFSGQKKRVTKGRQRQELIAHLSQLRLNTNEQQSFLNAFNRNADDLNSIKKQASVFTERKINQQRKAIRSELLNYLKGLKLERTNLASIMKNFDETNTNLNVLKTRAKEIEKSRKHEKWVEGDIEFRNYLNTLNNLSNQDRVNITSKISNSFVNWNALKKQATNLAVKRASDKRKVQRDHLEKTMDNYGFDKKSKRIILNQFDDQKANVTTLMQTIKSFKQQRNQQKMIKNKQEFVKFLNPLNLNRSDKNELLEKYNNGTTTMNNLKKEATNLVNTRRKTKRDELFFYVSELNLEEKDKNLIMRNFNKRPSDFSNLKKKAKKLKNASNAAELAEIRKELSEYLKGLNMLTNQNRKKLLNALPRASAQNVRNKANQVQGERVVAKKTAETTKLAAASRNLEEEDRAYILNKFNKQNVTLNSMLKEVAELKKKKANSKRAAERTNLYQYINNINLNVKDRNVIMTQFDKTDTNLATMKGKANSLKKTGEAKKLAANRSELEKYMKKTLKLSQTNVNSILAKFNAGENTILSLKTNADELLAKRKDEKRLANRNELIAYFKEIGLSEENGKGVLNKFNTTNIILKSARQEAAVVVKNLITQKRAQNRLELVEFMNTLQNLTNVGKKKILKEYDSETANLNTLKNRASEINTAAKNKAEQRRNLYQYINGLGINATPYMNKFDTGKSTSNSLKASAKKAREELNAKAIDRKKDNLRVFMKNMRISGTNKNSFLNRINLNTDLNSIKKEVKMLNSRIGNREQKIAGMKTELRVFLNTLNNVTPQNKQKLIAKIVNNSTNVSELKNEARALNKGVKNKRAEVERLKKEEEIRKIAESKIKNGLRLESHLKSMKDLTANRVEYYKRELAAEKGTLAALMNQSRGENDKQKSEKAAFYKYIRNTKIPRDKQKNYIARVKAPRSNLTEIKKLVNANINAIKSEEVRFAEQQEAIRVKKEEEAKKKLEQNIQTLSSALQNLTNLTDEDRKKYINSLKERPTTLNIVLKQAKEKNAGAKRLKAKLEEEAKRKAEKLIENKKKAKNARDKMYKNTAESLRTLTNLTRNNRKMFMGRLNKNGQRQVISNATGLDDERKKARREEESARKIEAEKKRLEEEAQKKRNANALRIKKVKEQEMKNVASRLQSLTSIERENRKRFMARLAKNGAQKVVANATALNGERKAEQARQRKAEEDKRKAEQARQKKAEEDRKKAEEDKRKAEEAIKKAEEDKKKAEENKKKSRNLEIKSVATKLQGLSSLERANRKKFMNRLSKNGAQKVVANATTLNKERKVEQARQKKKEEMEKKMIEDKKKAEEARKKFEEAKRKSRNRETKRIATRLQGLTSLERENRKKFMNRLAANGSSASKILANAQALNADRKDSVKKIRNGVEWKLKKIGAQGSNLRALMKRWNNSKNKTIFNEARKKASDKQPMLDKITREIPGTFGQWRRGWEDAVRKADTPQELQRLDRLLDEKSKLRKEIEKAPIAEDKRRGQLRFVMKMANDVGKRRAELAKDIKDKRDTKDRSTKDTATKLQSMDRLGRNNRKRFMNRIAGGESGKMVLKNADKLQRDRTAKQRLESERKERERQQSQQRKEQGRKTRDYEKQKQGKLRGNTARMLQGMTGLERKNRQEFMKRLNRGEEPSKVIANAQKRSKSAVRYTGKTAVGARATPRPTPRATQPQGRVAPRTKKLRAKNRTRAQVAKKRARR